MPTTDPASWQNPGVLPDASTNDPLGADETYTSTWVNVSYFSSILLAVATDQNGTYQIDFSPDGVNVDSTITYTYRAGLVNVPHRLTITRKWARVVYTNGSVAQTYLRLQTMAGYQNNLAAPLNLNLAQDADAIPVRSVPVEFDIMQGKKGGVFKSNKLGKNSNVPSSVSLANPEFITEQGGVYTGFPTSDAETITISSSSTEDSAAGTGTRTLTIIGLDENWEIQSETVTLNGTSGVATVGTYRRAHTMFQVSSGSNLVNVGTITARHTTTTANIFLTIIPSVGSSNYAVQTVPANKIGVLVNYTADIRRGGTTNADGAFYIADAETGAYRYRRPFSINVGAGIDRTPYGGVRFSEKTDIAMVITQCSQNLTIITGGFDILFIDN